MDPVLIGLLSFVAIVVLIFVGLHVGTALIIVAIVGLILIRGPSNGFSTLQYVPYDTIAKYDYAVFPLFILMGELISASGVVTSLFDAAQAWFGKLKGGLGMTVTAMGAALGTVTGSAIAAAAMIARTVFPEMVKHKYDPGVIAGLIAAVAPLALVIPPSIFLPFYGLITRESIAKLLIAGFIPGFLAAGLYMLMIFVLAMRNPQKWPTTPRSFTWPERMKASKGVIPIIVMMLVVLGGIYGGVFTPSEGGAAGSIMAFLMLLAYQRKKSGRATFAAIWQSAGMTSMVFFITIGAFLYGRFMSLTGAATEIVDVIAGLSVNPYVTFALVVILYLLLGCFLDGFSILAITLPVVHPLMVKAGFDPIWLGVVVIILVGAGTITPPFGIVVFSVKGLLGGQVELWSIFVNSAPFLAAMMATVVLMTIWPQIALFLPTLMK
ncbi:MAG: TRAP transporter large permease [Chloroflexi bacterium]|nr:TRAP transporter large permease [Chloroflexota bacterium]